MMPTFEIDDEVYVAPNRATAERMAAEAAKRKTPSFMSLQSAFGGIIDDDEIARRAALSESKRLRGETNASSCQIDNISPSVAKVLEGYTRAHIYPPTEGGKRQAVEKELEYREFGQYNVRVRKVACKDLPKKKYGGKMTRDRWTVWLRPTSKGAKTKSGEARASYGVERGFGAVGRGVRGSTIKRQVGAGASVGDWMQMRPAARAVECPKCAAPEGASCVTELYPDGSDTNSHKVRVLKYISEIKGDDTADLVTRQTDVMTRDEISQFQEQKAADKEARRMEREEQMKEKTREAKRLDEFNINIEPEPFAEHEQPSGYNVPADTPIENQLGERIGYVGGTTSSRMTDFGLVTETGRRVEEGDPVFNPETRFQAKIYRLTARAKVS